MYNGHTFVLLYILGNDAHVFDFTFITIVQKMAFIILYLNDSNYYYHHLLQVTSLR